MPLNRSSFITDKAYFLELRDFILVDFYFRRFQFDNEVRELVRFMPPDGTRQHQIDDPAIFRNMFYRLVYHDVVAEKFPVLSQDFGQRPVVNAKGCILRRTASNSER